MLKPLSSEVGYIKHCPLLSYTDSSSRQATVEVIHGLHPSIADIQQNYDGHSHEQIEGNGQSDRKPSSRLRVDRPCR